jgi:hypothetical protein
MTEPDNFLERWSKRKLAKGEEAAPKRVEPTQENKTEHQAAVTPAQEVVSGPGIEGKPFDSASLPTLESIDANTDITGFLRPGVPPELSRAALRRAWSADPAIRDFVGLVENGWDFNDPNAMPGFGPITPAEVARLAGQMLGQLPDTDHGSPGEAAKKDALPEHNDQTAELLPTPVGQADSAAAPAGCNVQRIAQNVAPQKESDVGGQPATGSGVKIE